MFLSEFYQKDLKVQVLNIALSQPNQLNDTNFDALTCPPNADRKGNSFYSVHFILNILFCRSIWSCVEPVDSVVGLQCNMWYRRSVQVQDLYRCRM